MHWGRWLFWGGMAALTVVVAVLAFRSQPIWVEVATVQQGPLKETIREEAKTRVIDRYVISAPVAGYLQRINVDVGDTVKAGEAVGQLEPLPSQMLDARSRAESKARIAAAEAALQSAQSQSRAAQASADEAAANYQRLKTLSKTNLVSEETLQQAQAADQRAAAGLRSARFNIEVARHELDAARTQLAYSVAQNGSAKQDESLPIQSPVNGVVLKVLRESEGVVSPTEPLLEVGDPRALEVVADVLSFDAVKLHPGLPVELEGWGGPTLTGLVSQVEPQGFTKVSALGVDEQRVRVVVSITSPRSDWQNLGDAYRIDTVFVLWSADKVLQVPLSATFKTAQGPAVFVVENGRAVERPVRLGHDDGFMTEVLDGLKAGERVVRHPDSQVSNGTRVKWQ